MKQKPSVYIETSIISYLAARKSRDIVVLAHQQITLEWWNKILPKLDPFISAVVLDEIGKGDASAAATRLKAVKNFPSLSLNDTAIKLAEYYFKKIGIPQKAYADALHLALASVHEMDYLVSWNCVHIVGARVRKMIGDINMEKGIKSPTLCTPEELMDL